MKKLFQLLFLNIFLLSINSASAKLVEVISFNDFHGSVTEQGKNPGMAKFVTAVKQERKNNPGRTIIVSGGDNFQGSALSVLTHGAPVVEMMKELGVSVSAVGNHEFDWGIDKIKKWEQEGDFTFVAANIIDKKNGVSVSWAKPYVIIEKNGAKIAFIGLTTLESAYKTTKENVENLKFTDPVLTLQNWINYLNQGNDKQGKPDAIIALTHIASYQDKKSGKITGYATLQICERVKGLDALITAHSHEPVCGFVNKIPVIQAYEYGRSIGILKLYFTENSKLEKIVPSLIHVYKNKKNLKKDKKAEAIYKKYHSQLTKIDKTLAVSNKKLEHDNHYKGVSPLGELVCKIIAKTTGTQIAITNGGGLRCSLDPGKIKVSNIYRLMPFDNYILTMKLKGNDLKRIIEHGLFNPDPDTGDAQFYGIKVFYNSKAPYMQRIESMELLDGKPVLMDKYYSVSTSDFIYEGGDKYDFKGAKDVKNTHISIRDMIIEGFKKEKNIKQETPDCLIDISKESKKAA